MMIELQNTHVTRSTVFRSTWFDQFAGGTFLIFGVDDIVVMLLVFLKVVFLVVGGQFSRTHTTCFIVDVETD